ncbi:hypothetical protein [Streptomyces spectabilis]|uniref:Uncharacterized protein n=1 Tax=Streptomyces spectabilis TaxID=68270 RepID=A0A516RJW3_STRST|nr:hypothetical protein [Streptomyces spectabilis]QDQ15933.1 hypothetical protein FH965_39745 [Streptomyces spectabilis]
MRQEWEPEDLLEVWTLLVQRINTRAEKKVEGEFAKNLKRVRGKEGLLLRVVEAALAEAALAEPGGTVRRVIYPVAGETTLKALAAEEAANEARYRARVRTVLRSSYSGHWRRMLLPPLGALELKCDNTAYRPVMDAIDLLKRYLDQPIAKEGAFFDESEGIALAGGRCVMDGARRSWTSAAASSASRTSCVCSWRCGTRCDAGRSGCRGRAGGRTPRTICRRTSRTTGTCTTTRSASRRTPGRSSGP